MKKLMIVLTAVIGLGMMSAASATPVIDGGYAIVDGKKFALKDNTFKANMRALAGIGMLGVMVAYVAQSQAQGVLPCHSRPDVKIDRGGYVVYATDCEVNGFK